ncbi:hypothetical protein SRABI106_00616 [Rahnella aquatilis]|nr:hypothetical protein SRABI106_00616 [Rahnella aquatilis]
MGLITVTSGVKDLQGNFAASGMHRVSHHAVMCDVFLFSENRTALINHALRVRGNAAGDNQPDACGGTFCIKGRQTFRPVLPFFQPGVHGTHQHAIFQLGKT